jgi:tRNA 2-thiouridine synthesizing protein B
MAILHTVNKSPLLQNTLVSCLRLAAKGDGILLIEDGVYGALSNTVFTAELAQALSTFFVYGLQPDLIARGLLERVYPQVKLVDYDGFVELTIQYDKLQAWF